MHPKFVYTLFLCRFFMAPKLQTFVVVAGTYDGNLCGWLWKVALPLCASNPLYHKIRGDHSDGPLEKNNTHLEGT